MPRKSKNDESLDGFGCLFILALFLFILAYNGLNEILHLSFFSYIFYFFLSATIIILVIYYIAAKANKESIENHAQIDDDDLINQRSFHDNIDSMAGLEFEKYICSLLCSRGYDAYTTKASGDFGVDIVAEKDDNRFAIQVKRYSGKVSRNAVSDAVAGRQHYNCDFSMVITNNYFTEDAIALANSTSCKLIDRDQLNQWIKLNQDNKVSGIVQPVRENVKKVKSTINSQKVDIIEHFGIEAFEYIEDHVSLLVSHKLMDNYWVNNASTDQLLSAAEDIRDIFNKYLSAVDLVNSGSFNANTSGSFENS